MEQDRGMLLSNDVYVRSKYKESTSLSNKKAGQVLSLCKVVNNEEVAIVMNLSYEDAREYEINLLWKELKEINATIDAVDYFLNLGDFREYLIDLKGKGDIDFNSVEGSRLYRALSKFDVVYKYNNTVGVMGKLEVNETSTLYVKLENYRDSLLKEFNMPIIDLEGANWVGVGDVKEERATIILKNGESVTIKREGDLFNQYMNDEISKIKDIKGKQVFLRNSEIAMIREE